MNRSYTLENQGSIFEYKFHNFYYSSWRLELLDNQIVVDKKVYEINSINKLLFAVDGTTYPRNPYGPTLCVSNIYLELKNNDNPIHILTIAVEEEYVLCNDSESFRITSDILKIISEKYNIPFNYSLGIVTEKNNMTVAVIAILIPLIWIIIGLLKK